MPGMSNDTFQPSALSA
ncbi:hypothetical protein [Victivallis vadensis]